MSQENSLTAKQKRFCEEYMVDCNAKQAAIRAGYSRKSARETGPENLLKPAIGHYIQILQKERSERTEIDADYVLKGLREIADDREKKTSDRLRAYELLGRHLAMFTDKTEHGGSVILESVNYGTGRPFESARNGVGNN